MYIVVHRDVVLNFAMIANGHFITNKNVPAYALMVGVPAKQIGWMSQYGEALDLPLTGNAQTVCDHTGDTYVLSGAQLSCIKA